MLKLDRYQSHVMESWERRLTKTVLLSKLRSTVKPAIGGYSKIGKTKVLMANGYLMQVKNIAECSFLEHSAITFGLH